MTSGTALPTEQAHALRRAEARWLQSARDRLRARPGRAPVTAPPARPGTTAADDAQETR